MVLVYYYFVCIVNLLIFSSRVFFLMYPLTSNWTGTSWFCILVCLVFPVAPVDMLKNLPQNWEYLGTDNVHRKIVY